MRETHPEVRLIASPMINWDELHDYLKGIKGLKWYDRVVRDSPVRDGEVLTEAAGRMCYRSWDVGLNPNVKMVREDSEKYFTNLLASGHGSVLEHANYTFLITDVSRVFTHELVRHRVGVAISQESMRYVRFDDIPFRIPECLEPVREEITGLITEIERTYLLMIDKLGIGDEKEFAKKKVLTSALRRILPDGISTCVTWTANVRELRHTIKMRSAPDAEEEMRIVFGRIGSIMKEECPYLFRDFVLGDFGEWKPEYVKV